MKFNVRILAAVTMLIMALSSASTAQGYGHSLRANIPFSFYANGALQPAGTYNFAINVATHGIAMSSEEANTSSFLGGSPGDGTSRYAGLLTFVANEAGVYVLQSAQWPEAGVNFDVKGAPGRSLHARLSKARQTVIAQLP